MSERMFSSDIEEPGAFSRWGAIWAGTLASVAIWTVFGLLGEAIFASVANPNVANPISGLAVGIGFWAVILTIVAMFIGGRTAGRLAGVARRSDAIVLGMIMFALSLTAAVVISTLGAISIGSSMIAAGTASTEHVLRVFATLGWIGFVSSVLGWLAAIGGTSSALLHRRATSSTEQVRHAAA